MAQLIKSLFVHLTTLAIVFSINGTLNAQERQSFYDAVKGWSINAYSGTRGFLGCDAQVPGRGWLLRIGFDGNIWAVGTQSNRRGVYPGNLEIDGRNAQVNFEHFPDGWAMVQMTAQEVRDFRKGSRVGVDVGQGYLDFSLTGSAAAMLKVEECFFNQGRKPRQRIVQNNPARNNNIQQAPRNQNQLRADSKHNQPVNVQPASNHCRSGEQLLPQSGLCTDHARRLLNISAGNAVEPIQGCSMAVNEVALPGSQYLLYKGLRCNNVTTQLEYSAGAKFAELSVVKSGYNAGNGVNPNVTDLIRSVIIGAIDNNNAKASLLDSARSVMDQQSKASNCKVVFGEPFGYPASSYLVHTRDKPSKPQKTDEPDFDGGECGELGYFSESGSYWRSFGGYNWYFEIGQDIAEIDPNTFTIVERDKADQWQIVY